MPGEGAEVLGNLIGADDQADAGGTIGYEILTALKQGRYNRNYGGDGNLPA
jgi:alanine racemase